MNIDVQGGLQPGPSVCARLCAGGSLTPCNPQSATQRHEFLAEIWDRLEQAQQFYKRHYDRHHREVEFQVLQWVWLQLLH
jgi:hypothetical protein